MKFKSLCVILLVTCTLSSYCVAENNSSVADAKDVSTETLINLLNKPLDQKRLNSIVTNYKIVITKGKVINYEARDLGFLFVAYSGTPLTFRDLTLKINNVEGGYLKKYKPYSGKMPLNITRSCTADDIVKQFKLTDYKDRDSYIKYQEHCTGLQYSFFFVQGGELEFICIEKIEK